MASVRVKNRCGEQRPTLIVQDSVTSAPRFDVGGQDDGEASLIDLGSDETDGGCHRVRCRLGRTRKSAAGTDTGQAIWQSTLHRIRLIRFFDSSDRHPALWWR